MKGWKVISLGTLLLGLATCRQDDSDAWLSLKSRTARLVGTWKLTSVHYTDNYDEIYHTNELCTVLVSYRTVLSDDGLHFTRYDTISRWNDDYPWDEPCQFGTAVRPFTASFQLTVHENGSYQYEVGVENVRKSGWGIWHWKDGVKKKRMLAFDKSRSACKLDNMVDIWPIYAANIVQGQWYVEQLTNSHLVLTSECQDVRLEGSVTIRDLTRIRLVFTKENP